MREHLYRGKRKDNGEWEYGNLYVSHDGKCFILLYLCSCDSETLEFSTQAFEVIPETVGEYTGLKDKNGVRIFEGDILQIKVTNCGECDCEGIGAVIFEVGNFGINYVRPGGVIEGMDLLSGLTYKPYGNEVSIIGNIHDNRELLEEAT